MLHRKGLKFYPYFFGGYKRLISSGLKTGADYIFTAAQLGCLLTTVILFLFTCLFTIVISYYPFAAFYIFAFKFFVNSIRLFNTVYNKGFII
jgi:hypothetical protein